MNVGYVWSVRAHLRCISLMLVLLFSQPNRTYYLMDPSGNADRWCKKIQEVWRKIYHKHQHPGLQECRFSSATPPHIPLGQLQNRDSPKTAPLTSAVSRVDSISSHFHCCSLPSILYPLVPSLAVHQNTLEYLRLFFNFFFFYPILAVLYAK